MEWTGPDEFVFRQNKARPFYFKRADGERIEPHSMKTDGGSIPRALWGVKDLSPWSYGPGYIIHDWLFEAHHCGLPEVKQHTVASSADVLEECLKTLMETNPKVQRDEGKLGLISFAVRTKIAENLWDHGVCNPPVAELPAAPPAPLAGLLSRTFSAGQVIPKHSNVPGNIPKSQRRVETFDFDKLNATRSAH